MIRCSQSQDQTNSQSNPRSSVFVRAPKKLRLPRTKYLTENSLEPVGRRPACGVTVLPQARIARLGQETGLSNFRLGLKPNYVYKKALLD